MGFSRVKWLEIHSVWTKTPRCEQWDSEERRVGPALPRPHVPHSPSQETSPSTHVQKRLLGGQKGSYVKGCSLFIWLFGKSILAKKWVFTHGRILRSTKYGLWTKQVKVIGQRNPGPIEECPMKVIQTTRVWLSDSPSESAHLSIHTYCIFSLNKCSTCFTTFHLCGNSFLQCWRAQALVNAACIVARIWFF